MISLPGEGFVLGSSGFGERLVRLNGLDAAGFAGWDFLPGMRFGERAAWWRGGADRGVPHEGLDLCWFRTRDGRRLQLGAGARVPAILPGRVVAVVADFLGSSVFVAHESLDPQGWHLHTVCGHVVTAPGLGVGTGLGAEDLVGAVAPGRGAAPAHLHVTAALIAGGAGPRPLDWDALRDETRVRLFDPLPMLCGTMPPHARSDEPTGGSHGP